MSTPAFSPTAVLIDGNVITGKDNIKEYASRRGVCPHCGTTKTHKRVGYALLQHRGSQRWDPITTSDSNGNYTVYKGYCLQPTCYTLIQVQEMLGEFDLIRQRSVNRQLRRVPSRQLASSSSLLSDISANSIHHRDDPRLEESSSSSSSARRSSRSVASGPDSWSQPSPDRELRKSTMTGGSWNTPLLQQNRMYDITFPNEQSRPSSRQSLQTAPVMPLAEVTTATPVEAFLLQLQDGKHTCSSIISFLQDHGNNPETAKLAFTTFRSALVEQTDLQQDQVPLTTLRQWFGVVWCFLETHIDRNDIATQALATLLTGCAMSDNHAQAVGTTTGLKTVLQLLEKEDISREIQVCVCALLESCSRNSSAVHGFDGTVLQHTIRRLAAMLDRDEDSTKSAIRTLYHLAIAGNGNKAWIRTSVLNVIRSNLNFFDLLPTQSGLGRMPCQSTVEAHLFLAWQAATAISTNRLDDLALESIVDSIVTAVSSHGSLGSLVEAALGLSAQLLRSCLSTRLVELSALFCDSMEKYCFDDRVQTQGLLAFRHLMTNGRSKSLSREVKSQMVATVVEALTRSTSDLVTGLSCQVLAEVAQEDTDESRSLIIDSGSVQAVALTFQRFLGHQVATASNEDAAFGKLSSLGALQRMALLLGTTSTQQHLDAANLLSTVVADSSDETDPRILLAYLRLAVSIIQHTPASSELDGIADQKVLPIFEIIMKRLRVCETPGTLAVALSILASFYEHADCDGKLEQLRTLSPAMMDSLTVITHTSEELHLLTELVGDHRDDAPTVQGCMAALFNLLAPSCTSRQVDSGIVDSVPVVFETVLDAMGHHGTSVEVCRAAASLSWVALFLADRSSLERWTPAMVERLMETLEELDWPTDICLTACHILCALTSLQEHVIHKPKAIRALVEMLDLDDVDTVLEASKLLAFAVDARRETKSCVSKIESVVAKLIRCIEAHPSSPELQYNLFRIIEHLVRSKSFRKRFANSGGFHVLSKSLNDIGEDDKHGTTVCNILVAMLKDAASEVLWDHRQELCEQVIASVRKHEKQGNILVAVLQVTRALCAAERFFMDLLSCASSSVTRAMSMHLDEPRVLTEACVVIRLLARSEESHDDILDCDAIGWICNAMLANPDYHKLQLEGMTAIKNLASEVAFRPTFEERDIKGDILCLAMSHYKHPHVLTSSLTAFNNVIVDVRRNCTTSTIEDRTVALLEYALKRYPKEHEVQASAILVLQTYTYEPRSLQIMQGRSEFLLPLLFYASEHHPGEVRQRAASIIDRL